MAFAEKHFCRILFKIRSTCFDDWPAESDLEKLLGWPELFVPSYSTGQQKLVTTDFFEAFGMQPRLFGLGHHGALCHLIKAH